MTEKQKQRAIQRAVNSPDFRSMEFIFETATDTSLPSAIRLQAYYDLVEFHSKTNTLKGGVTIFDIEFWKDLAKLENDTCKLTDPESVAILHKIRSNAPLRNLVFNSAINTITAGLFT